MSMTYIIEVHISDHDILNSHQRQVTQPLISHRCTMIVLDSCKDRKWPLSWAIRCQKRQIDPQSNANVRECFPDTCCGSNAVQAKLKANCLIPLLVTTAAAGEAAKLHKFIRQIVFQIFRIMLQPGGWNFRGSTSVRSKISCEKPKQISHYGIGI